MPIFLLLIIIILIPNIGWGDLNRMQRILSSTANQELQHHVKHQKIQIETIKD